jgi:hypothetical protein
MCPLDPVSAMWRDVDKISDLERAQCIFAFESQCSCTLQQDEPLAFGLVVPEARRACLTTRDDSFNSESRSRQQFNELFCYGSAGQLVEEIAQRCHGPAILTRPLFGAGWDPKPE